MRILAATIAVLLSLSAGSVFAAKSDIMPPPHKAPRLPVEQLTLYERTAKYEPPPKPATTKPPSLKSAMAPKDPAKEVKISKDGKEYEGMAQALDGERLLIGEKEIRLFGIVTPGIGSNYGPQARQRLNQIIKGAVLCKVTDKDRDGRPIAFCGTVDTPDLSYEMLRQGWAMVDRKALKNNSLAEVYEKVEQAAQAQNKGLFAPMPMVSTVPLSNPSNSLTVPLVPAPNAKTETASTADIFNPEAAKPQAAKTSEPAKAEPAKTEAKPEEPKADDIKTAVPGTALMIVQPGAKPAVTEPAKAEAPKEVAKETVPAPKETAKEAGQPASGSFFERYQGIVGGVLWVFGAFAFGGAAVLRDRMQMVEKRKALAAALSGELTAARHICRTRASELIRRRRLGEEDTSLRPSQLWPRIRAVVYQAHVASIGLLGSDLARRVASIYGQCADYATYYQQTTFQRVPSGSAVSQTLSNLADHIDTILDGLAYVEQTGKAYVIAMPDEAAVATNDITAEQQAEQEQQARQSVDEEAKAIKERFERMATGMVDMLGRKREAPNSAVAAAQAAEPVVVAEVPTQPAAPAVVEAKPEAAQAEAEQEVPAQEADAQDTKPSQAA